MKISKNSWHYRFGNWYYHDVFNYTDYQLKRIEPNNRMYDLCSYMRTFIFIPSFLLFLSVFLYVFSFIAFIVMLRNYMAEFSLIVILVLIGTAFFSMLVVIVKFSSRKLNNFLEKNYDKEEIKTPNVFIEYVKAKKKKFCPLIEFVEQEGE